VVFTTRIEFLFHEIIFRESRQQISQLYRVIIINLIVNIFILSYIIDIYINS